MTAISLIGFVAARALIGHYRTGYSLGDPDALRVVVGTGVYPTLIGVIGATLGWIVRSAPGSLVAYIAVILVLPVLFGSVLGTWGKDIAQFMPSGAGASFVRGIREPHTLSPWTGLAVPALWAIIGIVLAGMQLRYARPEAAQLSVRAVSSMTNEVCLVLSSTPVKAIVMLCPA